MSISSISGGARVQPIKPIPALDHDPRRRQPQGGRRFLSVSELEEQDGIKAQHAAARFIIDYLAALKTGWTAEETEVGGSYDRQGMDLLLIETATGRVIPADLSFAYKDEASVQYRRDWFTVFPDGTWEFRKEFAQQLFRQFLKLMQSNRHFTRAISI